MRTFVVDTNIVSILFNDNHQLHRTCTEILAESEPAISFMTLAELRLWPIANRWGNSRRSELEEHLKAYLTLYPDERTCAIWAELVDHCRRAGRRIQAPDAWIAATALRWDCPLVTTDFGDFEAVPALDIIPVR